MKMMRSRDELGAVPKIPIPKIAKIGYCYAVNAVKYRISVKDRYLRYRLSR
ncbi:hypothetical protein HanPSC8_Chr02g0080091 [Helianthus annuus]|nr:hypothetical protein HanPSC8_Chr02g0080091 [Helianthus annuus]